MSDEARIEEVVRAFFSAFHSAEAERGSLDRLPALFAADARITTVLPSGELRTESVPEFVQPRRALLLGGGVTEFSEWETEGVTLLGRDVACRRSRYAKKGVRDGRPFTGGGTKVITLVRARGDWKILTLLWQDDA